MRRRAPRAPARRRCRSARHACPARAQAGRDQIHESEPQPRPFVAGVDVDGQHGGGGRGFGQHRLATGARRRCAPCAIRTRAVTSGQRYRAIANRRPRPRRRGLRGFAGPACAGASVGSATSGRRWVAGLWRLDDGRLIGCARAAQLAAGSAGDSSRRCPRPSDSRSAESCGSRSARCRNRRPHAVP